MQKVKIIKVKRKRAKERVAKWGDTFELVQENLDGIMVRSFGQDNLGHWFGWFTHDEASWEFL